MNKVKLPQVLAPLQARLQALESSTNGVAATAPIAGAGDGAGAGAGAGGVGGGDGAAAAATDATTQALLQRVADIEARHRLVGKNQLRTLYQGSCQPNSLLLPTA